jgi:biopolymer transport protein ExbB
MANVKRKHFKRWWNGFRVIIAACIGVGVIIWKFIMGNPENFEGGNKTGTPLNT